MQRLAEARKYAQEYVIRKCEDLQRFNEYTVETDEEAASVILHLRLAYSAAKHADMGAPAVRNLEAFNRIVKKAKEAVAKQTPESFMLSVPQQQQPKQQAPSHSARSAPASSPPPPQQLMSRDDMSIASDDSRRDSELADEDRHPPRLQSAEPALSPERQRRNKHRHTHKRADQWDIRTSESLDGTSKSASRYAVSVKPGQRVRVRALGRSHS